MNTGIFGDGTMTHTPTSQRAFALTETAITLPLLLFMFIVIFDFGRIMYSGIISSNAARAAVGYGAQATAIAVDHTGMNNAAQADATDLPIDASNPSHVASTARHFCRCPSVSAEVSCTSNTCSGAPEVYVEVTTSRVFNALINYPGIPNSTVLQRTAIMRVQ